MASKIKVSEVLRCIVYILIFNVLFAAFLISWVTDDDLKNLPKPYVERFVSVFYFLITTFTTTGYGDIYAESDRMKLFTTFYMILIMSLTGSFLLDF
jgi:hypothetical protein